MLRWLDYENCSVFVLLPHHDIGLGTSDRQLSFVSPVCKWKTGQVRSLPFSSRFLKQVMDVFHTVQIVTYKTYSVQSCSQNTSKQYNHNSRNGDCKTKMHNLKTKEQNKTENVHLNFLAKSSINTCLHFTFHNVTEVTQQAVLATVTCTRLIRLHCVMSMTLQAGPM